MTKRNKPKKERLLVPGVSVVGEFRSKWSVLQQGSVVLSCPCWCWGPLQSEKLCWQCLEFANSHKLISPKVQFFEKIIKCRLHSKSWSFLIRGSSLCCAFYLKSTSDRQCTWSYSSMGNFSLAFMSYWHGMSPALALMPVSTPAVRKSWLSRRRQQRTGRVGFKLPEDGLTNGDTLRQQSFEILP